MADDSVHALIDSIRTRVQAELDAQLGVLAERHDAALSAAQAAAEARVAAEVAKVRIEAEQNLAEETSRLRAAAGQAAAAIPPQPEPGLLLEAFREIEAGTSASGILSAIARAAAAQSTRSALFVANGPALKRWSASGAADPVEADLKAAEAMDLVTKARTSGAVVRNNGTAVAVPLLLDGVAVGVVFGGNDDNGRGTPGWGERLEAIARFGSAHLGYLTALRTVQANEWIGHGHAEAPAATAAAASENVADEAQSARRYARLLVSEIKLYNEAAVREGRERRDLLRRLGPEIDRARRLYEERVPTTVPGRAQHFHQELVQTLAGGDSSLLG